MILDKNSLLIIDYYKYFVMEKVYHGGTSEAQVVSTIYRQKHPVSGATTAAVSTPTTPR